MAENRHPFGDLLDRHLSRKRGLNNRWLSEQIDVGPSVISRMRKGERLTNRDRILDIVKCFHKEGVLSYEKEATALLEATGLCRLQPGEVPGLLKGDPQFSGGRESSAGDHQRGCRWKGILAIVVGVALVAVISVVVINSCREREPSTVIWQEDFDPLQESEWVQVSARWYDNPGPTATLTEYNPDESFGKAETGIIAVDASAHPTLRVNVTDIAPGSSYSVQILDKQTGEAKDLLSEMVHPGEHTVDIAAEMGWQRLQTFTINLWVGGEGGSVSFDLVSVEADPGPR